MVNKTPVAMDEFGNVWPRERPVRMHMTAQEFSQMFFACATVAVHTATDEVYAGGPGEEPLELGFKQRGLDPAEFQLGPGPLDSLDLSFLTGR